MRVTRILDLIVIVLLAVVLLMPRPDVTVKPALRLPPERREHVAELQALMAASPDSVDTAIELANLYLDGHRPDWALATVGAVMGLHQDDFRLHHLRAIAYADRFEGRPAFEAAVKASELCDRAPPPAGAPACGDAARARLALLRTTLESVSKVDMRDQPALAKDRIMESLHPVFIPRRRPGDKRGQPSGQPPGPAPAHAPSSPLAPSSAP
jgi:hypothetical protein